MRYLCQKKKIASILHLLPRRGDEDKWDVAELRSLWQNKGVSAPFYFRVCHGFSSQPGPPAMSIKREALCKKKYAPSEELQTKKL
jgi:hypothetical protein